MPDTRPAPRSPAPRGQTRINSTFIARTYPGERTWPRTDARLPAVISSPDLGVFAVTAAGVLCAFSPVVDALSRQCLRRKARANPLFVAAFRTRWLLRERCAATCHRRRRPGQVRRRQVGLQITAVRRGDWRVAGPPVRSADLEDLRVGAVLDSAILGSWPCGALDTALLAATGIPTRACAP